MGTGLTRTAFSDLSDRHVHRETLHAHCYLESYHCPIRTERLVLSSVLEDFLELHFAKSVESLLVVVETSTIQFTNKFILFHVCLLSIF